MRYICYKSVGQYWVVDSLHEALDIQSQYGGNVYEMLKITTYKEDTNE